MVAKISQANEATHVSILPAAVLTSHLPMLASDAVTAMTGAFVYSSSETGESGPAAATRSSARWNSLVTSLRGKSWLPGILIAPTQTASNA